MNVITVNELFSGIGAQRAALERLGVPHKIVGISEIDKYAIKSYEAIYGETRNYGDISKVEKLDYADFWTYSFPCTDISIAGKQAGIIQGQTRSGLLYEVQRLLEISKQHNELPKFLMLENVKNLVSKKFKPQFDDWLKWLNELGYNTYYKVLNAKDYGVPQNRERVFAISVRRDIDDGTFEFPQGFDSGIRLKDVLEEKVDEKYYLSEEMTKKFMPIKGMEFPQESVFGIDKSVNNTRVIEYANCITAREDRGISNRQAEGAAILEHPNECIQSGNLNHYGNDQMNRTYSTEGISPTVMTKTGGGREVKITEPFAVASRGRYIDGNSGETEQHFESNFSGNSNAITTVQKDSYVCEPSIIQVPHGFNKDGEFKESTTLTSHSWENNNFLKYKFRIRKLTPKECWRLMKFKDKAFEKASSVVSNSQLYKQAGNSIVVDVLYYIFGKLFNIDTKTIDSNDGRTDNKLIQVGELNKPQWTECRRRVYSSNGLCPTLNGIGCDGNTEPKIVVDDNENFTQPQTE